ncbi:hypothetical protein C2G38_2184224 [Gigaspora rosea]|uniref:Uncharacterized protein n=1 Tax=Gigaspora rosea TaxID=44941 RepID=A0A397V9J6_9GLOM|nr:hypothetical protein C2G38_2184224 [Gigaspora rosea]
MVKKELNQRGIQYNDKQIKSELVTILRQIYNLKPIIESKISILDIFTNLYLFKIIFILRQVANTSNFIEGKILFLDKENQLETRMALKEMQEYEKRGGRKHMTVRIIELLKSFFHAGDIDKSERYTAKDMLDVLEKKAKVGELETSEVPKLKTIENWIGHYAQQYKKDLAKKAQNLSSETLYEF